jgi:hypothetical protein
MSKYANKINLSESEAEIEKRMKAAAERRIISGREFFVRECLREGIDPARGVSPSLLKTLGSKNAGSR